jgi:hypothetical protein
MKSISILKLSIYISVLFIFSSCKKDGNDPESTETGKVNIELNHLVGTQALQFNTQTYTNANGDDFKVTTLKYYLSNFILTKSDGSKVTIPESYYLVNAADASSTLPQLDNVPAGDYTKIDFTIGVDEARNFAGAQTGALDPAKGMFWSWNSGYIFLMFEGTSSKSKQASNQLFFHVGGAKAPTNAVRTVSIDLPQVVRVRSNTLPDVHFFVDLACLFKGKTTISFANTSGFHGGADAVTVADNYVNGMFRVDHIHN